jgi:hypothetical protein
MMQKFLMTACSVLDGSGSAAGAGAPDLGVPDLGAAGLGAAGPAVGTALGGVAA